MSLSCLRWLRRISSAREGSGGGHLTALVLAREDEVGVAVMRGVGISRWGIPSKMPRGDAPDTRCARILSARWTLTRLGRREREREGEHGSDVVQLWAKPKHLLRVRVTAEHVVDDRKAVLDDDIDALVREDDLEELGEPV